MYGNMSEEFEIITASQLQKVIRPNVMELVRLYVTHVLLARSQCKLAIFQKSFYGMSESIYKRLPVILDKAFTSPWKSVFQKQPDFLIIIPVTIVTGKVVFVTGTAVLAFYSPLPQELEHEKLWHTLLDYLQ